MIMDNRGFGAFLRRLRGQALVRRWNFHYTTKDQTVAEHSYWVTVYAMLLADMENQNLPQREQYDLNEVMRGALLHDWEEAVTSDLPSLVKRTCREGWSKVEEEGFDQLTDPILALEIKSNYKFFWRLSRDCGDRIGIIIKAADLLDRLAYAYDEQQRGNRTFEHIVMETTHQLKGMQLESVNEILQEWGHKEGMPLPALMTHL